MKILPCHLALRDATLALEITNMLTTPILYFEFQIGKWSTAQRAVFYDSVLPNVGQPDRGRLDGSFHKVVIALVRNTG